MSVCFAEVCLRICHDSSWSPVKRWQILKLMKKFCSELHPGIKMAILWHDNAIKLFLHCGWDLPNYAIVLASHVQCIQPKVISSLCHQDFDYKYNIALRGGVGYAAPMAITNSEGRRLYRLSGFVDFTTGNKANHERVDALVDAARADLPDLEIIDSSACHRPLSADDRALIGPTKSYPTLFLCTGFGSRGLSIGLGGGKLLAIELLGLKHDIDPSPYLPIRFN